MVRGNKQQAGLEGYKDAAGQQLVEQVLSYYSYLIDFSVDRLMADLPPSVDRDDLYAEGMSGLIEAVKRYDPKRNVKFETFATFRIRGSIMDYLRKLDWAPRRLRREARRISGAQNELEKKLGRMPDEGELAKELQLRVEEYRKLLSDISVLNVISFRDIEDEDGALALADRENIEAPLKGTMRGKLADALAQALASLPERDRLVLHLYYNEELSLKEIGEILELSESRICQIHTASVIALRRKLQDWRGELG
jgi:RNA polymerase sigma factor for flagellar operon FliA